MEKMYEGVDKEGASNYVFNIEEVFKEDFLKLAKSKGAYIMLIPDCEIYYMNKIEKIQIIFNIGDLVSENSELKKKIKILEEKKE